MLTVSRLCDAYLEAVPTLLLRRTGRAKKEGTLVSDRGRIDRHIKPLLGDLPVDQVTAGATAATQKTKSVAYQRFGAERASPLARPASWAPSSPMQSSSGWRDNNPVRGVTRYADQKRDRRLTEGEYRALFAALDAAGENGVSSIGLAAIRMLILTGWRRSEVTALRWTDIDMTRRTARLGDTKSGLSIRLVSRETLEIITAQPRTSSPFVFPARKERANPVPVAQGQTTGAPKIGAMANPASTRTTQLYDRPIDLEFRMLDQKLYI